MNLKIHCITNKRKTTKNEWENDSNFLPALYILFKKLEWFITC